MVRLTAEPVMLCRLVAHHSCAIIEASERGLADVLGLDFEPAPYVLSSALTYCDMTTSPDGEPVPAGRRLAEVRDRPGCSRPGYRGRDHCRGLAGGRCGHGARSDTCSGGLVETSRAIADVARELRLPHAFPGRLLPSYRERSR